MTEHLHLPPHHVLREDRPDGSIILQSGYSLPPCAGSTNEWLEHWAYDAPEGVFLAQRSGAGWKTLAYGEALEKAKQIAAGLLAKDVRGPILILSGNSIDHALLTLAAHYVGLVTVPVAEQYSLIPAAHARLKYIVDLVQPDLVFADDGDAFADAMALVGGTGVASTPGGTGAIALHTLTGDTAAVDAARARVRPETVAKLLLTSGSTSDPKAVETTQRMMTTNQAQIGHCLPFVKARPPVLVDWLPWNHVFGGSHNFNLVLANGGTIYIDDGKPLPDLFPRTVENLGLASGTISFNVPVGFAQLITALEKDTRLREVYFRDLDMIFYAGASLPQETWSILERMAIDVGGRLPLITSSWGLTETAPAALLQHAPSKGAGIVGVPLPGVSVKLVDDGTGRMDVRVKGGTVFSNYHGNATQTQEVFDEDGFFVTGDAMRFVEPGDLSKGLRFDGRLSEDFKLSTGIWVHAATLRLEMLTVLRGLARDVVICGAGHDEVGIFIVPGPEASAGSTQNGALCCSAAECIRERMEGLAAKQIGSARTVTRALVLADPPSIGAGEITAKGNLNFARILERRAELVGRLYDNDDPASIVISR